MAKGDIFVNFLLIASMVNGIVTSIRLPPNSSIRLPPIFENVTLPSNLSTQQPPAFPKGEYILATSNDGVWISSLEELSFSKLHVGRADALDVDPLSKKVFWMDGSGQGAIKSAGLDGSDYRVVASGDISQYGGGIAVDPYVKEIYWTRSTNIEVVNYDGSGRKELFRNLPQRAPAGITVHFSRRELYWVIPDEGIFAGNCDGTNLRTLVVLRSGYLDGIALNLQQSRIYWTGSNYDGTIESVNLWGQDRRSIFDSDEYYPGSIHWYDGDIYYTDIGLGKVNENSGTVSLLGSGGVTSNIFDLYVGFSLPQEVSLDCGEESMTVYLDKGALGISPNDVVAFANSNCSAHDYGVATLAISTAYDDCGTTMVEDKDSIKFFNRVVVRTHSDIRSSDVDIQVNCSLGREYHARTSYQPQTWTKLISEAGYGNFSVIMYQYPDERFDTPFPPSSSPKKAEVDSFIYMGTSLSSIKGTETINTKCWATESPDPMDTVRRDIIENGCPSESDVTVYESQNPSFRPFAFKVFSFGEDLDVVYVHCDVVVCKEYEPYSKCSHDCKSSRLKRESRPRRDTSSGPHTVTQGPFMTQQGSPNNGQALDTNGILLIVACVCLIVFSASVIILAVSVVYSRRHYQKLNLKHDNAMDYHFKQ